MNKQDFPILQENLVYLDNSATTHKPRQVIKAITDFYESYNSNVHRGIHKLSQQATLAYEDARQVIADFIGAKYHEIVFTKGTTESLNLVACSLVKSGDEIVLTQMEHHSNLVPWQQFAQQRNATLKFIPITKDFRLDVEKAKELITHKTRVVSLTHISNVLGTVNAVKELVKHAHSVGAIVVVDAAQSVPHMPVNVKDLDCDFLAFSGHKMCGPTGIGILYGKLDLLEKIKPSQFGGGMIKEVNLHSSTWEDLPERLEAGTPNIAGAIGLATAVKYLQGIGMDKINAHCKDLTQYALAELSDIPGLKIIGPNDCIDRAPVFSFIMEDIHSHDLSDSLDNNNIAVRVGNHCAMPLMDILGISGTTRASFYFYNTKEDVDKLVEILSKLVLPANKYEITSDTLSEEQEIYKENIIDHYQHPHNKGILDSADVEHVEYNKICGDKIRLFLQITDGKIKKIKWCGEGCAISQASISLLSDELAGLPLEQARDIDDDKVLDLLGIPISHTRIKCALLSLKTLNGALK